MEKALNCLNDVHLTLYPTAVSMKLWYLESDDGFLDLSGALISVAFSKYVPGEGSKYIETVCEFYDTLKRTLGADVLDSRGPWTWGLADTLVEELKDKSGREVRLSDLTPGGGPDANGLKDVFD
ncbi:hypothetical protein [Methanopyrus kandleri]